jgi:hypothetical protein
MVIRLTIQQHGYGALANTLVVAASEGDVRGRDARFSLNYVDERRDNFFSKCNELF